jgi:hypothetical protein
LRQIDTDQEDVRQLWEATNDLEEEIRDTSVGFKGSVVTHTFAGAGAQTLEHGLGITPTEWTLLDVTANVTIWRTAWTSTTITLNSSGAASIRVRVAA